MCRLLAYLGPPIPLHRLVVEPEHSLLVQSYAPREMTSGVVNADGFGFAWYDPRRPEPFLYRSILPIWADANLAHVAGYVESRCMLANVRSATPGQGLDFANTQPFHRGPLSAIHNGFVSDFHTALARTLRERLSDETYATVRGDTDSELLSAWVFQHGLASADLAEGLSRALASLATVAPGAVMSLNFIVSDGHGLAASRFALGCEAPSLYYLHDHAAFPGATLIASEPLFDGAAWMSCPEGSILTIDPQTGPQTETLAG